MLTIASHVLSEISSAFSRCNVEQGFLLGSAMDLHRIDHCVLLPAADSGIYFYEPNPSTADHTIREWVRKGICFCGLIHSHIGSNAELSENDIAFARQLYQAYQLPVLWFGLGVVLNGKVTFHFHSLTRQQNEIQIIPEEISVIR